MRIARNSRSMGVQNVLFTIAFQRFADAFTNEQIKGVIKLRIIAHQGMRFRFKLIRTAIPILVSLSPRAHAFAV